MKGKKVSNLEWIRLPVLPNGKYKDGRTGSCKLDIFMIDVYIFRWLLAASATIFLPNGKYNILEVARPVAS